MEKVVKFIKNIFYKLYRNEYVRVFAIVFFLGFVFFGTKALGNGLTMGFNGDYTLQTLALYSDGYTKIWEFIRTGEFPMFDFSNSFGNDYIGSASFYYLTSPLYYLLLLCPKEYLFQGIYILLLIKYAIGGTLFYVLLKKFFGYKDRTCLVGAIVYAFSGWNLFYLWFHFADAMAFFPLLLIGVEHHLKNKKGGLLALSLFVLALCNYFMFVTFAIFGVFYFIFRWVKIYGLTKRNGYSFSERWNVALHGALCYISGGLLAGIVLIPNLMFVQQSGRVDYDGGLLTNFLSFFANYEIVDGEYIRVGFKSLGEIFSKENLKGLYEYMFVWKPEDSNGVVMDATRTKLYIVANFLFMNTSCWDSTVFHHSSLDNIIGGTFVTTPLILLFIPTVIDTFKSKKKWDIFTLIFCSFIPFIPFTYYLLHGFSTMYGRWEIILVVLMLIYVLKTFDKLELVNRWTFSVAIVINVVLAGYCVYYSYKIGTLDMQYRILAIIGQFIYMFVVYHISFVYHKKAWFKDLVTGGIILELAVSTIITINVHGVTNYESLYGGSEVYTEERVVIEDLKEKDDGFYRIFNNMATRNYTNLPSALSYNGLSTFNSIYNRYNIDFFARSKMAYGGIPNEGALSSGYHEKRPYFDEFLGVKYYIVDKNHLNNDASWMGSMFAGMSAEIEKQEYRVNVPFGYEKLDTNYENFEIYENKEMIELGFAYENYTPDMGTGNGATYYETLYSNRVIIDDVNKTIYGDDYEEKVEDKLMFFTKQNYWSDPYDYVYNSSLTKHVTMRNDFSSDPLTRQMFEVSNHNDMVNKIQANYGQYGSMMHGRWVEQGYFGDEIILTSNKPIAKDASKENPANIILTLQMGPQCLVSLYGANDKLLTQDCHMYHNYSISPSIVERKMERSYYVEEEVKKIVIEFIGDTYVNLYNTWNDKWNSMFILDDIDVGYRYFNEFKEDWAHAKEYKLENITNTLNSFSFETNYENQQLVCLNVPYADGFTLTMDEEKVDMIVMNGGFIGFVAPSGNHSYYLNYVTPNITSGIKISLLGGAIGLVTFVGYNSHYCLALSKSVFNASIFSKKKKEEDVEESLEEEKVDTETPKKLKKVEIKEETTNRAIRVILSIITFIVSILLTRLFKSSDILGAVGVTLAVVITSALAYVFSYLFRMTNLNKESMIRYLKISVFYLLIALLSYVLLTVIRVYISYRFIVCFAISLPIFYLVYKYILKEKIK